MLNEAELRAGNTEGSLDLVVMCPQWRETILRGDQVFEVVKLMGSAFVRGHAGFRLNRLITENLDAVERERFVQASGIREFRSDFQEFHAKHPDTQWPRGRSLAVVTREEALRAPGNLVWMLFQFGEPVLGFQPSEQQLLNVAWTGLTDEELAHKLGIGQPAVKKRWRSIFARVSARPELFPRGGTGSMTGAVDDRSAITY